MGTYAPRPADIQHNWYVIDATERVLGRLATAVATRLRGKHKPEYTPHEDMGDFIVVINAEKLRVTGNKANDKTYYKHTGYPGGIKSITFDKLMAKNPTEALEIAITGMMPKGPLGRKMLKKLKIYAGAEHNHQAQQPQLLEEI